MGVVDPRVKGGAAVEERALFAAVGEHVRPSGGDYRLPTFGVRNPGTESTSYALTISYVDGQEALRPPADWFSFEPATFSLGVGESRAVETRLEIPSDAEPGDYSALIGPQIAADGGGAQVGAGAAARLSVTCQPSSTVDAWLRMLMRFLGQNPWIWIVGLAVLAVTAVRFLRRRFSFTVQRRG